MKVGDLLLLSHDAVKTYGVTACIFLGYKEGLDRTYIMALIEGRKVPLIDSQIYWTQRGRVRLEMDGGSQ